MADPSSTLSVKPSVCVVDSAKSNSFASRSGRSSAVRGLAPVLGDADLIEDYGSPTPRTSSATHLATTVHKFQDASEASRIRDVVHSDGVGLNPDSNWASAPNPMERSLGTSNQDQVSHEPETWQNVTSMPLFWLPKAWQEAESFLETTMGPS